MRLRPCLHQFGRHLSRLIVSMRHSSLLIGADVQRCTAKTRINLGDPVPYITHSRTSVLHLGIGLRHLSTVEGYLRVLVRPLGRALAFPC